MAEINPFSLQPEAAIAYFKAKGYDFPQTFAWQDMWQQAHATAFTVAKSTGYSILGDIHAACLEALENGQTFRDFAKNLAPKLQEKGWWGKKQMVDPETGEEVEAQLGGPRRLKTIYHVNLRTAQATGEWQRIQRFKAYAPFLRYVTMADGRVRQKHAQWHNTVLPADSPFWDTYYPPNDWLCRCYVQQLSQADLAEWGLKESPMPEITYTPWQNKRTGETLESPTGVHPAFAYNPGKTGTLAQAQKAQAELVGSLPAPLAKAARADAKKQQP